MSACFPLKVQRQGLGWGIFRRKQRLGPLEGELSQAASPGVFIIASPSLITFFQSPAVCWAKKMDPISSLCLGGGGSVGLGVYRSGK